MVNKPLFNCHVVLAHAPKYQKHITTSHELGKGLKEKQGDKIAIGYLLYLDGPANKGARPKLKPNQ